MTTAILLETSRMAPAGLVLAGDRRRHRLVDHAQQQFGTGRRGELV